MRIFAAFAACLLASAALAQPGSGPPSTQGAQGGQPGPAVAPSNAPGAAGPEPTERRGAGSTSGGQGGTSSRPVLPLVNPSPSSPQLYGPGDVIRHGGERRRKSVAPREPTEQPGQVQPPPQPAAPTQPGQPAQAPAQTPP
jgi:hypothetical protein